MSQREYVLGTDAAELERLGLQHRIWSAAAFGAWERAGIGPGSRVLDIGCGPGYATTDLAELVGPGGLVVGIDESAGFVQTLRSRASARGLSNVEAIVGDVHDLAGIEPDAFDAAYARWVLCFLPDPARGVQAAVRALRPGGRLCVQDYFNYECMTLAPKRPAFTRVIRSVGESWRARGGSPDIVGDLPRLMREAGLHVEHLDVNERIARPGEPAWQWPDTFWRSFVPRLVAGGFLTEAEKHAFFAAWTEASGDPDSFMFLPPVFDIVGRKPG